MIKPICILKLKVYSILCKFIEMYQANIQKLTFFNIFLFISAYFCYKILKGRRIINIFVLK